MDFLGVGVPELAVIIVLALIFVGPRDLPKLAGRAAKVLRDIRRMSEGISAEWQREVNAVDLDLGGVKELADELNAAQSAVKKATSATLGLDDLVSPKPAAAKPADPTPADQPPTAPPAPPAAPTPPEETASRDTATGE